MRSEITQAVKLKIRNGDFILVDKETLDSSISVPYAAGLSLVIELQHPYIGFITDALFTDKPGEKELYLKWCLPGERAILENLLFEYDKDELIAGSENNLTFLLDWLRKFPDLRIAVHGHTEPGGNTAYNKRLSTQRAAKVKQYLVERGIAKSRIEIIGHGGKQPIYNTNDPDARQKNRRVEFGILP
jgi:outer membrane protein OmpA-like peptidoglycan-associated protein